MANTTKVMKKSTGTPANANPSVAKATEAKKAALRGVHGNAQRRVRPSTRFHLPKTLKLARAPKYVRKSVPKTPSLDVYTIIRAPLNTESAMRKMEDDNTLVFLVDPRANKNHVRAAIKTLYNVDTVKINTLIRPDGVKKAFVRLTADTDALDIANRIGFI